MKTADVQKSTIQLREGSQKPDVSTKIKTNNLLQRHRNAYCRKLAPFWIGNGWMD